MRGLNGTCAWLPQDEQIDREVLPGDVIVAALVAARPTDVPDVVAGVAAGAAAGSTARAALRVRREPFLYVVLLVGRRVDELHPAVDAGQRPIGVGHQSFLSSCACSPVTPRAWTSADGTLRGASGRPAPRYPGADMESLFRGAPVARSARPYTESKNPALQPTTGPPDGAPCGGIGDRDIRPVTMSRRDSGWRARARGRLARTSPGPLRGTRRRVGHLASSLRAATGQEASRNRMLRLLHTADVHLGARHADLGEQPRQPSASASSPRSRPPSTSRSSEKVDLVLIAGDLFDSNTQPRRSVERVAAELARLVDGEDPDRHHPRHPRLLRPLVDLPRPTTSRRWPAARPTTTSSRS